MSSVEADGGERGAPPEWIRLQRAVRRLTEEIELWRARCAAAEHRRNELEGAVRDLSAGRVDPVALAERLEVAEAENRELRRRQEQAAELTRRLRARLDFLEAQ